MGMRRAFTEAPARCFKSPRADSFNKETLSERLPGPRPFAALKTNGTILTPQGQFTSGDGDTPSPVLINGSLLFGGSVAIGNNTNLNFYPYAGWTSGSSGGTSSSSSSS